MDYRSKEIQARRVIEDHGFVVHDANVIFGVNCPNIDLIVYAQEHAFYVQVKSSSNPAGRDCVIIDGSVWTEEQLYGGGPIFNKHEHFRCSFVVLVDSLKTGETDYYVAPPQPLEDLARSRALELAARPKKDGTKRSINFRKELPRSELLPWHRAWHLLGTPLTVTEENPKAKR